MFEEVIESYRINESNRIHYEEHDFVLPQLFSHSRETIQFEMFLKEQGSQLF